ncbi:hypothetical protein [Luteolibacter marinus]|uniref:hypothetical protein n=1 Tax=Luteolibacter marinus TaxID=2776705 RepID=UPI001865D510|nr:hypothetical protein [Luteolibacter marinus]
MNRRYWLLSAASLLLAACGASVGVGGGVDNLATVEVKTNSMPAVARAVEEVFRAEGFSVISRSEQSLSFTKRGGRSADIAWKTVGNDNPVMIRPTVRWRNDGPGRVWVGCQVEVAQQSDAFGETVREPLAVGKSAYHGLLKQVKQRVERGG